MSREKPLPPLPTNYPTQLPSHFSIGTSVSTPLVDTTELKAHLILLGAIHKLKEDVQRQESGVAATNKDLSWVVFVNRAVYRFFAWTSATWDKTPSPSAFTEEFVPPLDVMVVWHTYLLNPRAFYEDSRRMTNAYTTNLVTIENFPLELVASLIDPQTLDPLPPTEERKTFFEQISKHSYEMPLITKISDELSLDCPFCGESNEHVRWITDNDDDDDDKGKKGFAQPNFSHACEKCAKEFTKSNIGVRRFCEEVTKRRPSYLPAANSPTIRLSRRITLREQVAEGQKIFISETLLNPKTGVIDENSSNMTTLNMLQWLNTTLFVSQPIRSGSTAKAEVTKLANALGYDHLQLSDALHRGFRPYVVPDRQNPVPRRVFSLLQRIATAYSHAGLASLDLVGAVLRQGSFIQKMVGLGWTRPGRFDLVDESAPLVRAVARYHAFLDLMAVNPSLFLVPTLDIDLAWHTHQLKSPNYRVDTLRYLQRTPNHDDNVESTGLSKGYDTTAKAWKARFGVPYSVCGCVPDRDSQSVLGRVVSRIGSITSSKTLRRASLLLSLSPPQSPTSPTAPTATTTMTSSSPSQPVMINHNPRPDLVSTSEEDADASHPSEHNLHFGGGGIDPSDASVSEQITRREAVIVKSVASAKKGAQKDPWRGLQAERNEKRKEKGHKEAFTDPHSGSGDYYPYWGVSAAVPIGFYGGFLIANVGGCGSGCGTGGCGSGGCNGGNLFDDCSAHSCAAESAFTRDTAPFDNSSNVAAYEQTAPTMWSSPPTEDNFGSADYYATQPSYDTSAYSAAYVTGDSYGSSYGGYGSASYGGYSSSYGGYSSGDYGGYSSGGYSSGGYGASSTSGGYGSSSTSGGYGTSGDSGGGSSTSGGGGGSSSSGGGSSSSSGGDSGGGSSSSASACSSCGGGGGSSGCGGCGG
ncbi:hypothetical protein FRC17_009795 [Serendipita sp. 399]|nr:hypothetical protein FRC17_009795 [Serendipita sp. 399]